MIYTFGYGGKKPDQLATIMETLNWPVIIDVRLSPYTKVPGWSIGDLRLRFGTTYRSVPQFGNGAYRSGGIRIVDLDAGIESIRGLAPDHDLILLCAESSPVGCHRICVAEAIEGKLGIPFAGDLPLKRKGLERQLSIL